MRWHLVTLTALLLVVAAQAAHTQTPSPTCEVACQVNPFTAPSTCDCEALGGEQSQESEPEPVEAEPSCEVACSVNPFTAPAECNCNATITTGSGGPAPESGGGGETTPADILDDMIATYEAEMAQVENYLLIEKSKAAPLPDIRYYERQQSSSPGNPESDGGFVWIPNHELGRREWAADPTYGGAVNSRDEIPPELAEDPALALNGLADAFEILGQFAGAEALGAALGLATDQLATDVRAADQESRDGIEGADSLHGLLREDLWGTILHPDNPRVDLSYGYFGKTAGPGDSPYLKVQINSSIEKNAMQDAVTGGTAGSGTCMISSRSDQGSNSWLPMGTVVESGELWVCNVGGVMRPIRLSLTYSEPSAGGFVRTTVQEENKEFVRRGPALIPRKIQKRISRGAQFFIDELEREVRVNLGEPTQADLAELVGETMDWDTFYQTQGSP